MAPPDGTRTQEARPVFEWSSVPIADKYRLRLVEADTGTQVLSKVISNTSYRLEIPLEAATYFWRVRALNDCGAGNWSLRRSLTILPSLPSAPELLRPEDGSLVQQIRPTLYWKDVKGATGYRVQVHDDTIFWSPLIDVGTADPNYGLTHGLSPARSSGAYWPARAPGTATGPLSGTLWGAGVPTFP